MYGFPRFSPLLLDDSIDVCLEEREDSLITMATLRLLTHMVKSPAIVTLLCRQGGMFCGVVLHDIQIRTYRPIPSLICYIAVY